MKPRIAVLSFPGNNCEVESLRAIENNGMESVFFKWNDPISRLENVDGYFIPGGFSYEDRGRAGMIAARDPLLQHLHEEGQKGKVIIGNCNGAQILVESGLIPFDNEIRMALAKNMYREKAIGFINEWIYITPTCDSKKCATANWDGAMHIPLAHGEGRWTTKDKDLLKEIVDSDQLAFSYCDADGNVAPTVEQNPNGSELGIAGLCNPAGNIVALMPHPERTPNGDPYFVSMRQWIEQSLSTAYTVSSSSNEPVTLPNIDTRATEILIETIIVNNEERTIESALRSVEPSAELKQFRYISPESESAEEILSKLALFNPNKETAYIRENDDYYKWDADEKKKVKVSSPLHSISFVRFDNPDTGAQSFKNGGKTGIAYSINKINEQKLYTKNVLSIFSNPHSSHLEVVQ